MATANGTCRQDVSQCTQLASRCTSGGMADDTTATIGNQPNYTAWLETLFPAVPPPAREAVKPPKPSDTWSPEAIALAKSLLRTESLKKLDGGIDLREVSETFDPRWDRRSSHHTNLAPLFAESLARAHA